MARNSECTSPWQLWLKFCRWYNRKLSQFFAWLGETVGRHPLITITLALVVLGVCASGVAFIETENRTEKLYVPKGSEAIEDLDKAYNYGFHRPSRDAEIIILNSDKNVLTDECFEDALELHRLVVAIPGYQDVCLPNLKSDPRAALGYCETEEPLWVFNYTSNVDLERLNNLWTTNTGLFQRVFGMISSNNTYKNIASAKAMRMIYHLRGVTLDEDISGNTLDWEKEFLEKLEAFDQSKLKCSYVFTAERSLDDAISESTGSDIKFITLTFTLMISFACFMLGKYRNPLTGHGLLAMSGILCVGFGIITGFGLSMLAQTPFVSITAILPFLIVGVGIDDMFIIVDELDRTHPDQTIPKRLSAVMRTVGPAIAMTTITDLVAFAIGTTSKFPSIVFFCTFAALSITFAFLFLVTMFVVFMASDCQRMNAGRRDMVPCLQARLPRPGAPRWDEPLPQTSNKLMEKWGRFLMRNGTRVCVVLISIGLLAVGIYGTTFVNEEFDRRDLAKDGSEFITFLDTLEKYFVPDIPVNLILENTNYSDPNTQQNINSLTQVIKDNRYYRPTIRSWFDQFQIWYQAQNFTEPLLETLGQFLENQPQYQKDIVFLKDNSTIEASRLQCYLKFFSSSIDLRDGMLTLREDLRDKTNLQVFASTYSFVFFEQFVSTLPETVRNLALAATAICIVTSVFLVNPMAMLLVFLGFVSLIFELLGLMHIWGVSLNSISMINLVMAIGFAVDYSAHIAHAFVFSVKCTPEEKAVDALRTVGASVLMGGFSTFLGMVVTAFASSEIFRIFFKMFFGIVVLGLLHGLCFLPVWLSIFCRHEVVVRPEEQDAKQNPQASSTVKNEHELNHPISAKNHALSNDRVDEINLNAVSHSSNSHATKLSNSRSNQENLVENAIKSSNSSDENVSNQGKPVLNEESPVSNLENHLLNRDNLGNPVSASIQGNHVSSQTNLGEEVNESSSGLNSITHETKI